MAITEVFKTPTVKSVIFQIVFPNFFGIENRIGDFQLSIMEKFPNSKLLIRNDFIIANTIGKAQIPEKEGNYTKKIWQFSTVNGDVEVNVTSDSLDITSKKHKTYNNASSENKFRESISLIVNNFFKVVPLVVINRIGLRYLDECPLPSTITIESFKSYYNTYLNFNNIDDITTIEHLELFLVTSHEGKSLRFKETLVKKDEQYSYSLDFDGQQTNIQPTTYLESLDSIHTIISDRYQYLIKEPVIKIMNS